MTRASSAPRCIGCHLHVSECVCPAIAGVRARLVVATRVVLVMHEQERGRSTNTGALVLAAVPEARRVVYPSTDDSVLFSDGSLGAGGYLLFPRADALPLDAVQGDVRTLVVPDGTWRQAARLCRRVPALAALPAVALPGARASRYRLRTGRPEGQLATLEAVAEALALLESPATGEALLDLLDAWVAATLRMRGQQER
jgi:DTW domain-containing protein YfiP